MPHTHNAHPHQQLQDGTQKSVTLHSGLARIFIPFSCNPNAFDVSSVLSRLSKDEELGIVSS